MEEIWKDIEGYEGLYQVSNLGKVKSLDRRVACYNGHGYCLRRVKGKFRNGSRDKDGYMTLLLSKNGYAENKKIHRLVAEAFIPNLYNLPQVNHKDGNKKNNNVNNLEWVSNIENQRHAWKNGLKKPICYYKGKKGKEHNRSKVVYQVDKITRRIINVFYGTHEASRITGIAQQSISCCCNRKLKTAGGYIWKYKEGENERILGFS